MVHATPAAASELLILRSMPGAQSYEDLQVWQLTNELKLGVYTLLQTGRAQNDFDFTDQIRKSARAAPRLIAEGFGRYLPTEFIRYLRWANGEVLETSNCLRDGVDQGYFSAANTEPLLRIAKRSSKAISSLIRYLERCKSVRRPRKAEP
jgi:four helix bundle protein